MALSLFMTRFEREKGWSSPFAPLDSASTLVLLFGGRRLEGEGDAFGALAAAYPTSVLLGCSSAGEISGATLFDDTLVACVARFEHTTLVREQARLPDASGSRAAGAALGDRLSRPGLRGVLVLAEGLRINGSELASGLQGALASDVVVTGGLAGDGADFKETWTLDERGRPQRGFVTAVGFVGDAVRIGHGTRGGWDVFGPERRVTRSSGNVLHELDGRPALEVYKRYLGAMAAELPAAALRFPLEVRGPGGGAGVVRTVLSIDEQTSSMTFAGDIPQGHLARLMMANADRLIDGASCAAVRAGDAVRGPALCVAISCVGRRLVLGERADEETEATLAALPRGSVQLGMYSYGELSPHMGESCQLHNQTMTMTVIEER